MSKNTVFFGYNGGCGMQGVHVSKLLKEELAWATDKWLHVISNMMLFKTVVLLRS